MSAPLTLALAAILVAADPRVADDPRVELIELQIAGRHQEALDRTTEIERSQPVDARRLGLPYLRAHLYDVLGQRRAAASAFAEVVATLPLFAPYARLRIAADQEALGHPEVSAGVVASLLAGPAPAPLLDPAVRLLERTLRDGGDCRLVSSLRGDGWSSNIRRTLQLVHADCALRRHDTAGAADLWRRLLVEKTTDPAALSAADRLLTLDPEQKDPILAALVGASLQHHREFERSSPLLGRLIAGYGQQLTSDQFTLAFDHARSQFWQGHFETAAGLYAALAERPLAASKRGSVLFHRGRSLELACDWPAAAASYLDAQRADPLGEQASAALLAAARLEWRRGNEAQALRHAETLRSRIKWRPERQRAVLFFAASDLVSGRVDRAPAWLSEAGEADGRNVLEAKFWRARLAELSGQPEAAVEQYLDVMSVDSFHPLAQAAAQRLRAPGLDAQSERLGRRYAAGESISERWRAFLAFGGAGEAAATARAALYDSLARAPLTASYLALEAEPVGSWRLWQTPLPRPEEQLLALGMWREGAPVALRHFPVAQPRLALVASRELLAAGEAKRALVIAEVLLERKPRELPSPLLPRSLRRQLYPLAYADHWRSAALGHGVDPHLLAAIMREESRFDPNAFSRAAARGLTQFTLPTARRIAVASGLAALDPQQLYSPAIATRLGAAYLAELDERNGRREIQMVAAYNAGEAQAELWQSHCFTTDPAEYYSKVSFRETRAYVQRVVSSRGQYDDIYGAARPQP